MDSRIVDKVFEAIDANDIHRLTDWLITLGATDVYDEDGQVTLTGPSGIRGGFILTDPNTLCVLTGFAIAGAFWPQCFPLLQKVCNKRWKERKNKI